MIYSISKLIADGHTAFTLSNNAFNDMMNECFKDEKGIYRHNLYTETFPKLKKEEHDFVISSFQNGLTTFNKNYIGITDVIGKSFDVNSMYSSVMKEELLPYGEGVYYKGKFKRDKIWFKVYFQRIRIERLTLKEDGIECLRDRENQCYYRSATDLEIVVDNKMLEMLFDNYNVEGIEYIDGFKYRGRTGMFDPFINKWIEVKKNSEGFEREYSKLMLNSCFGKFVSRTDKIPTYCRYDKRHKRWYITSYVDEDIQSGNSKYAPVGCLITSYARQRLIKAIKAQGENFIYADTDSIYVKGDAKGIEIDNKELGKWKLENRFTKMNIIGKKQYCIEKEDGGVKLALAGVPEFLQKQIKSFDDFYIGKEFVYYKKKFNKDGLFVGMVEIVSTLKDEKII